MLIRFRGWLADLITGGNFSRALHALREAEALINGAQRDFKQKLDTQLQAYDGLQQRVDSMRQAIQQAGGLKPSQLEIYAAKAVMLYSEGTLKVEFEIEHKPGDNLKFRIEACKLKLSQYPPLPGEYIWASGKSWEAAFDQLKAEVQAKLKYKAEQDAGVLKTDIPSTGKGADALLSDDGKDALQAFVGGEGSTT